MGTQNSSNNLRAVLEQKYNNARTNLLIMLALTVVNIVLLFTSSDVMLLFSATIPYLAATFGIGVVGGGLGEISLPFFAISFVVILLYILCWIFSKKHYGWMIAALALFVLDTAALILFYIYIDDFSGILDFAIHICVLYYLITGVTNGHKLKNLPPEAPQNVHPFPDYIVSKDIDASAQSGFFAPITENAVNNSPIIRSADMNIKSRILLEAEYNGHQICYRRVKRINELVIDGYVYDDVEMLVEAAHSLNARIDNQNYQVGFDGAVHSYLRVNGVEIAKKLRLW